MGSKMKLEPEALSIRGKLFEEMVKQFDEILNKGVRTLTQKGLEEGTLTLKMKLQITENCSEDTPNTDTYIPIIDYKLGFNYTEKTEEIGIVGGADVQIYSENGSAFIVQSDPYGQIEMDI